MTSTDAHHEPIPIDSLLQLAFGETDGSFTHFDHLDELLQLMDGDHRDTVRAPACWSNERLEGLSDEDRRIARAVVTLLWEIDLVGRRRDRDRRAQYRRFAWTDEEAWLRTWFAAQARRLGLTVSVDTAGNQWAWSNRRATRTARALVVGSHLDSVPDGGAFDGPLGIVLALVAISELNDAGWEVPCPIAIVNFHDREGTRFSISGMGSRVLSGELDVRRARKATDTEGQSVRDAMCAFSAKLDHVRTNAAGSRILSDFSTSEVDNACQAAGAPEELAADPELLASIGAFLEAHIEQGSALDAADAPVGLAGDLWSHGRWRVEIDGAANHAGTTPPTRRADALAAFAQLELQLQEAAREHCAWAAIGRVEVEPNGVTVIASHVRCWIDCRAAETESITRTIDELITWAARTYPDPLVADAEEGDEAERQPRVRITCEREALTPATPLSNEVRWVLQHAARRTTANPVPIIDTSASHDAGVLQRAGVPSGMLFVRNATGVSHASRELAHVADCIQAVHVLEAAIQELAGDIARQSRR